MPAKRTTSALSFLALVTIILCEGFALAGGTDLERKRGGRMYDKWWAVNNSMAPAGEHPLYPAEGQQSGSSTYRCKECHGWDYKGADGAYGIGSSHYTGIPGIFGSNMTPMEMFDIIKNPDGDGTGGTTVNGHDFGNIGLTDQDINDIVEFLQSWMVDTDLFIDTNNEFMGDSLQGYTNYNFVGDAGYCVNCHGFSGTAFNFGTPEDPEWLGTVAQANPWEFLHKVRIGTASEDNMPSWLINGDGTEQGAADIGRFAQEHLLAAPPAGGLSPVRGGLLYDKWYTVVGQPAPGGNHPLYPAEGPQSGASTHRCKECHGWDYKGADGAYGTPGTSHYTGIPGIFGSILTPQEMFDIIKNPDGDGTGGTTPNGHDFGALGLADADIDDLVEFLQTLLLDTDSYIDDNARFTGDVTIGESNYLGLGSCFICHGLDGMNINFGSMEDPEGVGHVADANPWEFLHKVRFGHPGSSPAMYSFLERGGDDQGAADIGAYSQQILEGETGCDGVPDSGFEIDDCGQCLLPDDPEFNQSCAGCDGVPNSGLILDECGECLLPDDPEFNQSCAGCDGIPNSGLMFDACGICGGDNTTCVYCGNGIVQTGEECDDGNNTDGDGCSADCQNEAEAIPTVSHWGLVILAMLLLIAAKIRLRQLKLAS